MLTLCSATSFAATLPCMRSRSPNSNYLTFLSIDERCLHGEAVPLPEKTMFKKLMEKLAARLTAAENMRRDAYLSSATDLADLERRSRYFEANHSPYSMYYGDRRRDSRDREY
jgi:hypothetical protein